MVFIGTAGWSISRPFADRFPSDGSSLARYSAVFNGVEVNSSFYRRHKPDTWQRWADSVPPAFRFSVKVPKHITHELRLADARSALLEFLQDVARLGEKLGPVLLQLPPNLAFNVETVTSFLNDLRGVFEGQVVIEPRHQSWASPEVSSLLSAYTVSRVIADPAPVSGAEQEESDFSYLRLHGSPRIYYSEYQPDELRKYAALLSKARADSWCIFDNTASGAALSNALEIKDLMGTLP
ncbi:MAG: hypothetical protein JWM58_2801 [Rhizobium sp.]|nr:hypothetical protein [Rhizobium sp.]